MSTSSVLPQSVYDLQDAIHYQFDNPRLLLEALRTAGAGYQTTNTQSAIDGNKRLAHLGDAILKMVLLEDWYHAGASRETANMQINRVSSAAYLCRVADQIHLQSAILTNPSQWDQPLSANVVGKSVQALVGAVWLDTGHNLEELRRVLQDVRFWTIDHMEDE